jgi:hypothetical protein
LPDRSGGCAGFSQHPHARGSRCDLLEQLHPLPGQAEFELNKAGRIAARSRKSLDEAATDRVDSLCHNDRYCAGGLLQGYRGGADTSEDDFRTQRDQFCCIFAQARLITRAPAIIDAQIAPGAPACLLKALHERGKAGL